MRKNGIDHELERYRLMLEGALSNPEILQALARLGLDRKAMLKGKNLLRKVNNRQKKREEEGAAQKETTQALHQAHAEAHALYITHVKYARMVLRPKSIHWNNLKLSGPRRKNLTGWLAQAQAFYEHVHAVAEVLARRGISAEELAQAQAMVQAVADVRIRQNVRKSEKKRARVKRDQDREALQQWMSKFVKAARYAFDEDKPRLQALGIVAGA